MSYAKSQNDQNALASMVGGTPATDIARSERYMSMFDTTGGRAADIGRKENTVRKLDRMNLVLLKPPSSKQTILK